MRPAVPSGVMTGDVNERTKLNSFRFVAVNIAQLIVVGFTLPLVAKFSGPEKDIAHGWSMTMGINAADTSLVVRVYQSTDSGGTWTLDSTASGTQTNCDREIMWIDHSPTSSFREGFRSAAGKGGAAWQRQRGGDRRQRVFEDLANFVGQAADASEC